MRVLVTGGCGFVGRNLCNQLLANGHEVVVVDDLSTGQHPKDWCEQFRDPKQFLFLHRDAISHFAYGMPQGYFHQVYHLASVVGGRVLIDGSPLEVAIDLAIDAAFFRWCSRNPDSIGHVQYASSSAAYPVFMQGDNHQPLNEKDVAFRKVIGQPDMTYGWSKLTGEYLARLLHERYGVSVSCIRPFSGYGPDQETTYPIPAIAGRVARRENPIEVWGSGRQTRDFVYITDVVDAMLLVADCVQDAGAVNIGTGTPTSFIEIAQLYATLAQYEPEIKPKVDAPVGVDHRYCDPWLIQELGWQPKVPLIKGLEMVLEHAELQLPKRHLAQPERNE